MTHTIEVRDDVYDRLTDALEEDETYGELIEELLNIYQSTRFVQEGYSE
jgi:predicted CopG family antitoxin